MISFRWPGLGILIAITIVWLHIAYVRGQPQRRHSWLNVACKPCHCHLNRSLALRHPFVKIANCSSLNLTNIPNSIPTDVELVDLSRNNNLEVTSTSLLRFPHIRILMLGYNALTTLPPGTFSENRKLQLVDFKGNVFKILPTDIFHNLNYLETIIGLDIEKIVPAIFQALPSLLHLSLTLHGNDISESLLLNVNLKSLELTVLHARSIPKSFLSTTTLLQRIIINGPMLENLDSSLLINHTMLNSITINVNGMEKLGDNFLSSLGQQVTLTQDDFRDVNQVLNLLKDQEKVAKSSARNYLQRVSIKGVTELEGKIFTKVPNLDYLSLEEVPRFPSDVFNYLQRLDTLQLSKNSLTVVQQEWFDGLSGLRHLNLSRNELRRVFANDFAGLNSLLELDLSHNNIRMVKEECFGKFAHVLRYLDLSQNKLCLLPEGIFDRMSSLVVLNTSHNCLASVPLGLFITLDSLQTLRLEYNRLTRIPLDALTSQSELQVLNISYNSVTDVPADIFDKLPSLKYLDLRGNRLNAVSADIVPIPSLIRAIIVYDSTVNCSCLAFREVFTVHGNNHLGAMFQGTCSSPHHLHGLEMDSLTLSRLCPDQMPSVPLVPSLVPVEPTLMPTTMTTTSTHWPDDTRTPQVHSMLVEIDLNKKTSDMWTRANDIQSTDSFLGSTMTHSADHMTTNSQQPSTNAIQNYPTTAVDLDVPVKSYTITPVVSTNHTDMTEYLKSDNASWQYSTMTQAIYTGYKEHEDQITTIASYEATTHSEKMQSPTTEVETTGSKKVNQTAENELVTEDVMTEQHAADDYTTGPFTATATMLIDDSLSSVTITVSNKHPITEIPTSTFTEDNLQGIGVSGELLTEVSSSMATTVLHTEAPDGMLINHSTKPSSGITQQMTQASTSDFSTTISQVQSTMASTSIHVGVTANNFEVTSFTESSLTTISSNVDQSTGFVHTTSEQSFDREPVQVTSTEDDLVYVEYYGSNSTDTYDNGSNTTQATRDVAAARQPDLEKKSGDLNPSQHRVDDVSKKRFYEEAWFYFLISFFAALFVVVLVIVATLKSRGRLFMHSYSLGRHGANCVRC
jgi:Leucine-rich repeat (LRR) protein